MANKIKEYIALFEYEKESTGYSVVFPDFPGVTEAGHNFKETKDNAVSVLQFMAEQYEIDGQALPEPRTLEEIQNNWEDWKEWEKNYKFIVVSVPLLPLPKSKKYLVNLDQNLVARIDSVTKNRSAFLAAAAEAMLKEK